MPAAIRLAVARRVGLRTTIARAVVALALVTGTAAAQERLAPRVEAAHTGASLAPAAVVAALTVPALVAVLHEQGATIEGTLGDTLVLVRHAGRRIAFQLVNDGQIVHAAFEAVRGAPAEAVNAWNRETLLARAWVDGAGRARGEADLDLEGGVTGARLRDHLRTVLAMSTEFRRRLAPAEAGTRD